MSPKTIPMSVRVSDRDAEFIAALSIEGATTPSDKLRAIITQARRRTEGLEDYASCLGILEETVAPSTRRLRKAELEERRHSELVKAVGEWMPEAQAFLMSSLPAESAIDADSLERLEAGLADRVFTLIENILRMGVTQKAPCYDPEAVAQRLGPVLELAALIARNRTETEET